MSGPPRVRPPAALLPAGTSERGSRDSQPHKDDATKGRGCAASPFVWGASQGPELTHRSLKLVPSGDRFDGRAFTAPLWLTIVISCIAPTSDTPAKPITGVTSTEELLGDDAADVARAARHE